jgi:hypothetical protein
MDTHAAALWPSKGSEAVSFMQQLGRRFIPEDPAVQVTVNFNTLKLMLKLLLCVFDAA